MKLISVKIKELEARCSIFLLLLISCVRFCLCWFMSIYFKSQAKVQNWTRYYPNWNKKCQQQLMRQSSMKQYFTPISSLREIWFCLAKKLLLIHQEISDYLSKFYQIFTYRLLEHQLPDEIKFYVVLCKTDTASTRLLRRKSLSVFWCEIN